MAIESKNLLVWVKAMSRGQALPLDASEIHDSLGAAETYAASPIAYAGQTVKALGNDGKYHEYIIQPSDAGYVLEEVGAVNPSDLRQYVVVNDTLPESGQEQGILYIQPAAKTGSVWNGTSWVQVFTDVQASLDSFDSRVEAVESALDTKAPLENPAFTGSVTIDGDEVAVKTYVDTLFAQLGETVTVPSIVDGENVLPTIGYKAGQMWRVAAAGTYAGEKCEVGDLILCIKDYSEDSASNADFMAVQANIDGAVTSDANAVSVGEIAVFNAVTGKVIGASGVQIASLNDAISKAHEHSNKEQLDSYDKTQTELLAAAATEAQAKIDALQSALEASIEGKADKGTTLADYGITDAYTQETIDAKLQTITDNLNTKVTGTEVDAKISTAKTETLEQAASAATETLETRIGDIPDGTSVKEYVDSMSNTGSADVSTAIAQAKEQAINTSKAYTDNQLKIKEF